MPKYQPKLFRLPALLLILALGIAFFHQQISARPINQVRAQSLKIFGPIQNGVNQIFGPVISISSIRTNQQLRDKVAALAAENSQLTAKLRTSGYHQKRIVEFERMTQTAKRTGYRVKSATVTAYDHSEHTVTINVGTDAGVQPDATVIAGAGLVGRVIDAGPKSSIVLLLIDASATVGSRLGSTLKVGILKGTGAYHRLNLELLDSQIIPSRNDVVVSWGSTAGGPFVPGIPIGKVTKVVSAAGGINRIAQVDPYVDFSALDVVGVVVPDITKRKPK